MSDKQHNRCYHVEEGNYEVAREKMMAKFGTNWGFQYSEDEWKVSKQKYDMMTDIIQNLPPYQDGMTQAELFNLTEI